MNTNHIFLFLVLILPSLSLSSQPLHLIHLTKVVVVDIFEAWSALSSVTRSHMGMEDVEEHMAPFHPVYEKEEMLMSRAREISKQVASLDMKVREASKAIMEMINQDIPSAVKYELRIIQLLNNVAGIEDMYKYFKDYTGTSLGEKLNMTQKEGSSSSNRGKELESYTLHDFAQSVVSHGQSVRTSLDTIHRLLVPGSSAHRVLQRAGVFDQIQNLTETNGNICNMQQSPQQLLYNLYNALQLTQLKAYTMIQFSWMLLRLYNKGNFTLEANMMRRSYLEKTAQQAEEIRKVMAIAKKDVWKCDPRRHIPDETYTEITKLLQGFIVNEVDLNTDMSCRENCGFYKFTKQQGCYKDNFCSKQKPCRGNIVGCTFVDSDMWICPSDSGSKRRYDWIEYENGRTLGTKQHCTRAVTKVDSWWRWLFWHCSYCICLCDDKQAWGTDRFFNLRTTVSDMESNKVITGLRFVKDKRVIHLQIQEGTMLPKGTINESTIEWKPVDSYDIKNAKDGVDYHTLTWDQRAIDFDDLKGPRGSVLTGIRFRKLGKHLNLEIQVSKFNFTSGKLTQAGEQSQWIGNDNTDASFEKPRKRLKLNSPDLPTKTTVPSIPDSEHDTFMEFENSDMDSDAAQSTVPYIDIQIVAPNPPVPLEGAGIHHKGRLFFGGFIAPKVFTMDFTYLIENSFPEINEMKNLK